MATVGVALLLVAVALVTSAQGTPSCQTGFGPDPKICRDANELVSGRKHEERVYWQQIAGAPHPTDELVESSPTRLEADLYSVRARNAREVIAGGAICQAPTAPAELKSCTRVPVIYTADEESGWRELRLSEQRGYVGAVAWIGRGKALAVGGSGTYPRREPNPKNDTADFDARARYDREHGAGDARAWYFHDGHWEDISDSLPEEMGGLSALDIWIGREEDGDEWGIAGTYGQLWEWEGGRFTGAHIDNDAPSLGAADAEWAVVDGPTSYTWQDGLGGQPGRWNASTERSDPELFQYRVREIRIAPDRNEKRAIAFTAGCCGPAATSRRIEYVDKPRKKGAGVPPDQDPPPPEGRPRWLVLTAGASNAHDTYGDSVYSFVFKPGRFINFYGEPDEFNEPQPSHDTLTWSVTTNGLVKAPGGAEEAQAGPTSGASTAASPPQPRYVGSDGDVERTPTNDSPVIGNGIPDWKVGEATDPELRGLGVLATTREDLKPYYGGLRPYCSLSVADGEAYIGDAFTGEGAGPVVEDTKVCRTEQVQTGQLPQLDPEGPIKVKESGVQFGPSWALNAVEVIDSENVGYAVGDRGAILRMSSPPAESDPPTLGERRSAALADRAPFEQHRPDVAGPAGEIPALAVQPRARLDEPRMVRAGSPDGNDLGTDLPAEDVHTIVMSRDGSEGWAVGPSMEARGSGFNVPGGVMTLHHYAAGQWTRCDPVGIPGIEEPDEACTGLAALYRRRESDGRRIHLDVAARIPHELDGDPTNDDEFELIAVGSGLEGTATGGGTRYVPVVLRYANGRWRLEDYETRLSLAPPTVRLEATSLACVAADECWLAGRRFGTPAMLSRFDGERWTDCSTKPLPQPQYPLPNAKKCGDVANRIGSLNMAGAGARFSVSSAGERVYLAASRQAGKAQVAAPVSGSGSTDTGAILAGRANAAAILYKDHGADEQWTAERGGYDPAASGSGGVRLLRAGEQVASVAVARRPDGRYEGWAIGSFASNWSLLRLDPDSEKWSVWRVKDAAYDLVEQGIYPDPRRVLALPGQGTTPGPAYIASPTQNAAPGAALAFDPRSERWTALEHPATNRGGSSGQARPLAVAPNGRGGAWVAFGTEGLNPLKTGHSETYYYDYTTTPQRELFEETPVPFPNPRERLTDLAGTSDGTVWVSTHVGALYRYDRLSGWSRITIPGWDAGRVVTRRTPVDAVALGPDGSGLAVGEGGRIADLSPAGVRLNEAAGTVCVLGAPAPPCSTSFDLTAAALAPGGAAMVGGKKLALLWRPAGEGFRRIPSPDGPATATVTGISLPSPERAFVVLDSGQLFAGQGDGSGRWRWRLENAVDVNGVDRLLTEDRRGEPIALRDIAVDASGHGFAVGDRGVILERTADAAQPWRRVESGVSEALTSVALPAGDGSGALAGGERGLILTHVGGKWRLARSGDQRRPDGGYVAGVALLPGLEDGQAEAWAGVAPDPALGDNRSGMNQLLHHSTSPDEPLLDPGRNAGALPDAPAPRPGEISFAAFGRSDCHFTLHTNLFPCRPLANGVEPEQILLRRIRDEVLARSKANGGPRFSIWTGDAYDTPGNTGFEAIEQNSKTAESVSCLATAAAALGADCLHSGAAKYRRFNEQLTDYLPPRDLPFFAAIGARDLSETRACVNPGPGLGTQPQCAENRDRPRVGENIAWRQGMELQPAPWGSGEPIAAGGLAFEPVRDSGLTIRRKDEEVDDPSDAVAETTVERDLPSANTVLAGEVGGRTAATVGGHEEVEDRPVPTGGAATHYALDVVSTGDDAAALARLLFVDTSPGSLAAADPIQEPLEGRGGQAEWLERMLCVEGSTADTGPCTRQPTQRAIVVSTTPTYSYGPTTPTETQADAAVLESILLRHQASVVVSGRLGWNGRYWATAPGVHEPCPGGEYVADEHAPGAAQRVCGRGETDQVTGPADRAGADAAKAAGELAETLRGAGAPPLPAAVDITATGTGVLPFVVASGAGGRFDELAERGGQAAGEAAASRGFWRGYSVVRLDPAGDPRRMIVEQRPVYDWVGIRAAAHVLRAGQRLALRGFARGPITTAVAVSGAGGGRFDAIDSPAITHRYDLLAANPERPYLPHRDADGQYVSLDPVVGTIDSQTGSVRAGRGSRERTFAIALLSVGDKTATWPLVFEPGKSFRPKPALTIPLPAPPRAPAPSPPQIRVLGQPPVPPPANPPPPAQLPNLAELNLPAPPSLPALPQALALNPVSPPPPPAPPAPPVNPPAQPLALNALLGQVGINAAPIPPNAPAVNPAPPSGSAARKEAKQRQAATAKSEEGSQGEATQDAGGDLAQSGPDRAMTRRDRVKPGESFTAITQREQASAWARGALYGGGLTLVAFTLALGWSIGRPTPRRRPPTVAAPAWAPTRRGPGRY